VLATFPILFVVGAFEVVVAVNDRVGLDRPRALPRVAGRRKDLLGLIIVAFGNVLPEE
jgi:Ca2+/Na+ antiporter